nr:ATP-binding cassette domain-containing protein [Leucobacter sp.]
TPGKVDSDHAAPAVVLPGLTVSDARIVRGERVVAGPVSFAVSPGEFVALAGPSGAGKSSILAAVLGFVEPESGRVAASGPVAWAGQQAGLVQGTILENVGLGNPSPSPALAREALDRLGLDELQLEQELGALGSGLSGGQAQRVAIARALYRAADVSADVLLLDEPSSALDAGSEALVINVARAEAQAGRAVLVVSHRPALLDAADRIVEITPAMQVSAAVPAKAAAGASDQEARP